MEQLYEDTFEKVYHLRDQGFKVIEMWECDLLKEMEHDEDMRRYFEEYEIVEPLQPRDAFYGDVPMQQNYYTSVRTTRRLGKNHTFIENCIRDD